MHQNTYGDINKKYQADAISGMENMFCAKIPKQVLVWCRKLGKGGTDKQVSHELLISPHVFSVCSDK